jgi:hypothetical protein
MLANKSVRSYACEAPRMRYVFYKITCVRSTLLDADRTCASRSSSLLIDLASSSAARTHLQKKHLSPDPESSCKRQVCSKSFKMGYRTRFILNF